MGKGEGRFGSAHTHIILYTPYNTQHGASRWSGPMTAAEVSRLYRELLRLRDGGPGTCCCNVRLLAGVDDDVAAPSFRSTFPLTHPTNPHTTTHQH